MDKYNILAVIVIYNPDEELLIRNINAIINNVKGILVWNNSPENFDASFLTVQYNKIKVKSCGSNIGISKALNFAWHYARNNEYDYLLTMDQDSVWINFSGFLEKFISFEDKLNIFGPEYKLSESEYISEGEYRITSGMLVPISLLDEIGGYYEDFMVDGIDVELCYRAREYGYHVYYISGSTLEHHAGLNIQCRFLWIKFYSDGYTPNRIYGIIRNHLIIYKRFKIGVKMRNATFFHYYLKMPIKILLGEKNKLKKLIAYLKGLYGGITHTYTELNRNNLKDWKLCQNQD